MNDNKNAVDLWFDSFRDKTALEARTIQLEQMTAERDHLLLVIENMKREQNQ